MDWTDEYKARMRDFLARKASPVEINPDAEYDFDEVSTYGWTDYTAARHTYGPSKHDRLAEGCYWVVPEGAVVTERTYSQFEGTFTDNKDEVGINVYPVACACGKYTDMTLRYVGSLAEAVQELTGAEHRNEVVL